MVVGVSEVLGLSGHQALSGTFSNSQKAFQAFSGKIRHFQAFSGA